MRKIVLTMVGVIAVTSVAGAQEAADLENLIKAMQAMQSAASNAPPVVDFRELKALLPATLSGYTREDVRGEKQTAMGFTISQAEAVYRRGESEITVTLSDNGGMGGMMAFTQAAWSATDFERETDTGFERTTQYGPYKAHEEYDHESRSGEIQILVGGRFMVTVRGSDTSFEDLQAAARAIDLAKLEALKPAPR